MKNRIFKILIIMPFLLAYQDAFPQPYSLIESESPYMLQHMMLEAKLLLGYETGHIPDVIAKPQLYIGLFNLFQVGGRFTYAYFIDQEERRIAEYELTAKARVFKTRNHDFNLFIYGTYRDALGDPVFAEYEGSLQNVVAVVSPRADQGTDKTGGITGRVLIHRFRRPFLLNSVALMFGASYTRAEDRDFYRDDYQNRYTFSVSPAIFVGQTMKGRGLYSRPAFRKNNVMIAVENRYTYWPDLGYMYDVIPQINWQLTKSTAVYSGVSLPVRGGKVYKYYIGGTQRFNLDTISATIDFEPDLFSPDGDGRNDILYLKPSVSSSRRIKAWRIIIYDPSGTPFKVFRGRGRPPETIRWNGRSRKGELVESAQKYKVTLAARDIAGKRDVDRNVIPTDIMFQKTGTGFNTKLILFRYNRYNIRLKFTRVLDRFAEALTTRYNGYRIEIQGHTDNIGTDRDNIILSNRRADAVRRYLMGQGISGNRITCRGFGERKPIASNRTPGGRRQNRRVEFVLIRR